MSRLKRYKPTIRFIGFPSHGSLLGAETVCAIDDFAEENGAPVVMPASHKWEMIAAVMPRWIGDLSLGTTWHGCGENSSGNARFAITHQYCEAYMRQQESDLLELSRDTVRALPPELQSLVGYSVYLPFMVMVEGKHPLRLLEEWAAEVY